MRPRVRQPVAVVAMALLGLAMAVALALLASRLSTQHIGVAAESQDFGAHLIAPVKQAVTRPPRTTTTTVTVTVPAPTRPVIPSTTRPVLPVVPLVIPTPSPQSSSGGTSGGGGDGESGPDD